jgi:Ca-activated chloride channel family protein
MRRRLLLTGLMLLTLLGMAVGPVFADGIIIPDPPPPRPPGPVPLPIRSLAIKYHRVTVQIEDQVATTHVDQVFVNDNPFDLEGTYIFPLPADATVSNFAMWVDGQKLEAQLLEADKAREIYEGIVRQRRDPALLEYVGRNAFQARVFPIPAHGEKRIELEYSQVLPADQGLVRYVYPLNTEKFSTRPLEQVSVRVEIRSKQAIKAVYSPSHPVDIERPDDYRAIVGYEETNVTPDKDFALYYSISSDQVALNVLSYKQAGEDGFFMLLAAPDVKADASRIVAKDVFLVLDVSGSMRGEKIQQAKQALAFVLDNLNPLDRFNVIAFSTSVKQYARSLRPASERDDAARFVRDLQAAGGTDLNRALLEALDQADVERPQFIILLTDGLPTEGETNPDRILKNVADVAPKSTRLFTFGVGNDVNTFLLDSLAQEHGGTSAYVRPGERIDEVVSGFYAKVSTPVLADLQLDFGQVTVEDVYPYPLPDLFAGSQLIAVGRYRDGGPATVTLRGKVNDQQQVFRYEDVTLVDRGGPDFIPRLWATRKIGYLLNQIRRQGENRELVDEIVELATRYGIVTPYTSFLINEEEDVLSRAGREKVVEQQVQKYAAPMPTAGAAAVQDSVAREALRSAQVAPPAALPAPVPGLSQGEGAQPAVAPIRQVGDKTFLLRDGVWTDTTFDPSRMQATRVSFGSDTYFDLLARQPEIGPYLALGDRVIVVIDGQPFEVAPGTAGAETQGPMGTETPGQDVEGTPSATASPGHPVTPSLYPSLTPASPVAPAATDYPPSRTGTVLGLGLLAAAMVTVVLGGLTVGLARRR